MKAGETPGYPRFKGKGWYKSFTFPQSGFKLTGEGRTATISLSKIGHIRIHLHRQIEGEIKTLTVKRDQLGNWYGCFSCEVECEPLPPVEGEVGVDLGLLSFAAYSDGSEPTANPRFFRRDERDLKRAQRKLSACQKGSAEWGRRKRIVQKIHKRIRNRRENFAHQLSRKLIANYQLIVLEDLDIDGMLAGNHRGLNKSVSDAAWRKLIEYVTYKAERAGRTCVLVDPRGTSQTCSACGELVPKSLSVRIHDCPHCGLIVDRDVNASRNILARGRAAISVLPDTPARGLASVAERA